MQLTEGEKTGNLMVWATATGELVTHYVCKVLGEKSLWPLLKWSDDEAVAYRLVSNEMHFFDGKAPTQQAVHKLRVENIAKCAMSPGGAPHHVATFVPEKKGAPAVVRLWRHADFGEGRFLASKSFYKASEVSLMWSPKADALLIHTHTEVDRTGKSYYGETGLFFMTLEGKVSNVTLNKEGPIHDVQWSPQGGEFAVVFGFSPSRTALFNDKCEMTFDFGEAPRNTISWSPHARFLAIAGFGNLSGELSFWDRKTLKCLGTVEAHMTVSYEWSPDSRHFLTAILFPRLRVDNGYRVWSCNGSLLQEEKLDELSLAAWRPLPSSLYAAPDETAFVKRSGGGGGAANKTTATAAKYVPRHMREASGATASAGGTRGSSLADLAKAQESGGTAAAFRPGQAPLGAETESSSASSAKNKAKREAKKKIRNVEKKIRQIVELKELVAGGKTLEANQLGKIKAEAAVKEELALLQEQLRGAA